MNTFSSIELRHIPLGYTRLRRQWEAFLASCGLEAEEADYAVGMYDEDDNLLACGSLHRNIIKDVAVSEKARSEALVNTLVTHLRDYAMREGHDNIMVFTKPEYRKVFESLAFTLVGEAPDAVMLESNPRGVSGYCSYLKGICREGRNGVIVMNCNPFTLGHLYLIKSAADEVDNLYVIPLADDPHTEFSYSERHSMITEATGNFGNVVVCKGSQYAVSASTFPSYFIKEVSLVTDTHIALDLNIFCRHIVPALKTSVRFVGSEPKDPLTRRYNELMAEILPQHSVEVKVISRITEKDGEEVISASSVRSLIASGRVGDAFKLLPNTSIPYVLAHAAALALRTELCTTPKPGLVDRDDCGAHKDMDFSLMQKSIDAIAPVFSLIGLRSLTMEIPSFEVVSPVGIEGEQRMMMATGGVNTHKGALFSFGLVVSAVSHLLFRYGKVGVSELRNTIISIASGFLRPSGTHGAETARQYGIKTALDNARAGYEELFGEWLPFYGTESKTGNSDTAPHRLLLKIMTTLDDSNVYHRGGKEAANWVKMQAADALNGFSIPRLQQMNKEFIRRNISPGGAADMMALTIFLDSILSKSD